MFLLCCFAHRFVYCIYRTVVVVVVIVWLKIENTTHLNRSTLAPVVLWYMLIVYMLFVIRYEQSAVQLVDTTIHSISTFIFHFRGRRGSDRMVVGFTASYVISAYHHWSCEFEFRSCRGVLDTIISDKVCHWLAASRCFSTVPSTNKIYIHDTAELLLKVALNTITLTLNYIYCLRMDYFRKL
jgi:hypothetical protein